MALFDFTRRPDTDELASVLEGYTDEYLESVLEADKGGLRDKINGLKQKASDAFNKALAPKVMKDPDSDFEPIRKEMMARVEKGDKAYIKSVLDATKPGSASKQAEDELNKMYMHLFPYNAKKIKAQVDWLNGPFKKECQKKAKELKIVVESTSLLEEAVVALFESDEDIRDMFLVDKDAVVLGAEDDEDIDEFINKIPDDIEDEDLEELAEAFVMEGDDCDDEDCEIEDDEDDEECEESYVDFYIF